jgi:hypothetical protein
MIKKILKKNKEVNKKKGLTILFAVLVSIFALAVGASIVSLSFKQLILSGSARDSQFAFYASNTGTECALNWDIQGDPDGNAVFATSSESSITNNLGVTCAGVSLPDAGQGNLRVIASTANSASTTFRLEFADQPYCVDVIVGKVNNAGVISTTLDSFGYNTCDEDNPRRIERGLQVTY